MVAQFFETRHSGGFMVSEANGYRSRDVGTFVNATGSDITLTAGTVLAAGAESNAVIAAGSNTGTGTLGSVTFGATALIGVYTLKATSSTVFTVTDPTGGSLPNATVGTPYSDAEINFTISAGGTAFVANDSFTITVSASDTSFVTWKNANPATAILFNSETVVAGTTKRITVVSRQAEVNGGELVYDPAITGSVSPTPTSLYALAAAQLKASGIIVRASQ